MDTLKHAMLVFVFIVAENNWQQFPQVRISNTVLIAFAVNDKTILSKVNNIINQTQSYYHFPHCIAPIYV